MIGKKILVDVGGRALGGIITFASSIFLARILTPEDFGLIAMVVVIIGISEVIVEAGFGSAIVQRLKINEKELTTIFYINIIIGSLLTCILFFCANWISVFYNRYELVSIVKYLSPVILISSLSTVHSALLTRNLQFRELSKINVMVSLISAVIGISAAFKGLGYWSLVIQSLVFYIYKSILLWFLSKWRPKRMFSLSAISEIWKYSSNIFLAQATNVFFNRLDTIIIGKYFMAQSLGFYNRAMALNDLLVQYGSGSVGKVMFPVLSQQQENKSQFNSAFENSFRLISFIAIGSSTLLYLLSEELVVLIFSEKWLTTAVYLKIIVIGVFAQNANFIIAYALKASGNSKLFLRSGIFKKLVFLSAYLIGVQFGVEGIVYAFLIGKIIAFFISLIILFLEKISSIKIVLQILSKDVLYFAVPFGITYLLNQYFFGFNFVLAALVVYLLSLILMYKPAQRRAIVLILDTLMNIRKK